MIPLTELNKMASKFKVPIDTVEKDYIISWILVCLSKSKLFQNFFFYGGTAIKRMYFEDHRFSEDIDFISDKVFKIDDIRKELSLLSYSKELANINLRVDFDAIRSKESRVEFNIDYSGFDEIVGAQKSVKFDLLMGQPIYGESMNKKVISSYSDIIMDIDTIKILTLNTLLAYKLGLLNDNTRKEPRDVYDIWFLLKRKDQFDFDYNKVCRVFREKYCIEIRLSLIKNNLKEIAFEVKWESRLGKQIAKLPKYQSVVEEILEIWGNIENDSFGQES